MSDRQIQIRVPGSNCMSKPGKTGSGGELSSCRAPACIVWRGAAETNRPRVRERLLACMHRKDGTAVHQITVLLKHSYSTVYGWLARVQAEGIGRRHDHAPPGRSRLLADAQIRERVSELDAGPEHWA